MLVISLILHIRQPSPKPYRKKSKVQNGESRAEKNSKLKERPAQTAKSKLQNPDVYRTGRSPILRKDARKMLFPDPAHFFECVVLVSGKPKLTLLAYDVEDLPAH